ncbi:MAG: ArsA-related P-loop ATPase [Archangium sp.]|nr:ArsA-related P-loop ATPase [Archangium sp.]MDP3151965.1 ArsA-related P-loop ATPase [Archangium sp.]MDP3571378.1 ArsA-related P-loop ATPase [Archangium sp.]
MSSLQELFTRRVVLMTGKGGVGRSSLTAALATQAQRKGVRVLICDIGDDPNDYSPLARHFGRDRFTAAPTLVAPGIHGVVLLARSGQELFLKSVLRSGTLARAALSSDALRRLLSAGPSFKEMGVFFQLLTLLRAKLPSGEPEHSLVLIDMPATGHTLSLTGLPELLLRLVPRGPIAAALREGQSYLNDPKLGAAWVVAIPETLPVSECLELLEGLQKTGMPTGGVLMNRVPVDPFSAAERSALQSPLERINPLGAEGFRRPVLARREIARLRAGTKLPIIELPELAHGAALISGLADVLEKEGRTS